MIPSDLPSAQDLQAPTLAALRSLGGSAQVRSIYAAVIESQQIPPDMTQVRYPVSGALVLNDRISWALSYLRGRGMVESPRRGWWRLAEQQEPGAFPSNDLGQASFRVVIEWGELRSIDDPRGIDTVGCEIYRPPEGQTVENLVTLLRDNGYTPEM